jgi:hypothetical protein
VSQRWRSAKCPQIRQLRRLAAVVVAAQLMYKNPSLEVVLLSHKHGVTDLHSLFLLALVVIFVDDSQRSESETLTIAYGRYKTTSHPPPATTTRWAKSPWLSASQLTICAAGTTSWALLWLLFLYWKKTVRPGTRSSTYAVSLAHNYYCVNFSH